MNILKSHISSGHANRPGKKLSALKAIVVHYTQNDSPAATAAMNVMYIGRKFVKKEIDGVVKKFENDGETPFSFGSAHIFCDMNVCIEAIPVDEVAWGCGDKNYKGGYQRIAEKIFKRRQNFETVSVEICNNDVIKNSDEDWKMSVENAKQWIIEFLTTYNLKVDKNGSLSPQSLEEAPPAGTVLLLRHFDLTGKNCPKPFITDVPSWKKFVEDIAAQVNI